MVERNSSMTAIRTRANASSERIMTIQGSTSFVQKINVPDTHYSNIHQPFASIQHLKFPKF